MKNQENQEKEQKKDESPTAPERVVTEPDPDEEGDS